MPTELRVNQEWESIAEAKRTIKQWLREQGLSQKKKKEDERCWIIICRETITKVACQFRIRVNKGPNNGLNWAKLTIFDDHTCPSSTHYGSTASRSVVSISISHAPNMHTAANTSPRTYERSGGSNRGV